MSTRDVIVNAKQHLSLQEWKPLKDVESESKWASAISEQGQLESRDFGVRRGHIVRASDKDNNKCIRYLKDEEGCTTSYLLHNFEIGLPDPNECHKSFLQKVVVRILKNYWKNQVILVGRANDKDSIGINRIISRKRARAVAKFLVRKGVRSGQIINEFSLEPFSDDPEASENRSVEVKLVIPHIFKLVLKNARIVRKRWVMKKTIKDTLGPVVSRAKRELEILYGSECGGLKPSKCGELILTFAPGGGFLGVPCKSTLRLGLPRAIYIGGHRDLRVCTGKNPRKHVFNVNEPEFARFVGNTAVHELGHMIVSLPDNISDPNNVMYTDESKDEKSRSFHVSLGTRDKQRKYYARQKEFSKDQIRHLVCAIKTGNYTGGI